MSDPSAALSNCLLWTCSPRGGNNFYGRVLNGCRVRAVQNLGTCGVMLTKEGTYTLCWDPEWFTEQDTPFQILVLVHEAAHLILRHLERGITLRKNLPQNQVRRHNRILNIALDMAANDVAIRPMLFNPTLKFHQYKDQFIWPEDHGYPTGLAAEKYYKMLIKDIVANPKKLLRDNSDPQNQDTEPNKVEIQTTQAPSDAQGSENDAEGNAGSSDAPDNLVDSNSAQGGSGNEDFPDWVHDLLDIPHPELPPNDEFENATEGELNRALDNARRNARVITARAINQTKKSRGVVPGELKDIIEEILDVPTVPWQTVLRGQIKSVISQKFEESTAYPNVALLHSDDFEPYPGHQYNFTFNILAAFDTSGSMDHQDFLDCCAELRGLLIAEEGVAVRLLHFDHALQHEEDLTTEDATTMQHTNRRYGYGDTSFEGPLRYAVQQDTESDWLSSAIRIPQHRPRYDLMLIFTDGYAPVPLPRLNPGIPLFWVLTTGGQQDPEMQRIVWMKTT